MVDRDSWREDEVHRSLLRKQSVYRPKDPPIVGEDTRIALQNVRLGVQPVPTRDRVNRPEIERRPN